MSVNHGRRSLLGQITAACAAVVVGPQVLACGKKAVHTIEIKSFVYNPADVKVRVGDTITWANHDIVPHTATAKDDSWDTGSIATGESKSIVVTEEMVLDYYCRFHPMMIAKITFTDS